MTKKSPWLKLPGCRPTPHYWTDPVGCRCRLVRARREDGSPVLELQRIVPLRSVWPSPTTFCERYWLAEDCLEDWEARNVAIFLRTAPDEIRALCKGFTEGADRPTAYEAAHRLPQEG